MADNMLSRNARRRQKNRERAAAIAQQNAQNVPGSQPVAPTTTNADAPTNQLSTTSGSNPTPASLSSRVQGLQINTASQATPSHSGSPGATSTKASSKVRPAQSDENNKGEVTASLNPFPVDSNEVSSQQTLFANHFSVKAGQYRVLYKYSLSFQRRETEEERTKRIKDRPDEDFVWIGKDTYVEVKPARPKRRRIFRLLCDDLSIANPDIPLATDYFEQIITAKKLLKNAKGWNVESNGWIDEVRYYDEYQNEAASNAELFRVTVTKPLALNLDEFRGYLSDEEPNITDATYHRKEDVVRALNIIFSYRPYQRCFSQPSPAQVQAPRPPTLTTKNGTKFHGIADKEIERDFDQDKEKGLNTETGLGRWQGRGNAAIRGFARSVRTSFSPCGRIALNLNTATSIFYQAAPTVQDLIRIFKKGQGRWEMADMNKFLKNLRVRTTCFKENYIGRVTGFATPFAGSQPIPKNCTMKSPHFLRTEQGKTVASYFGDQLLDNPDCFVITLGEKDHLITAPATHLVVVPGQINRNTDEKPAAGIITPLINRGLVRSARDVVLGTGSNEVGAQQFQISLAEDLLRVPFTKLELPPILYQIRKDPTQPNKDNEPPKFNKDDTHYQKALRYGSWNLDNTYFVAPATDCTWTCVELTLPNVTGCNSAMVQNFIRGFEATFRNQGMAGFRYVPLAQGPYQIYELPYQSPPGRNQLKKLEEQDKKIVDLLKGLKDKVDFVILLVPSRQQDLYGSIKRAGDQIVGLTTICHMTEDKRQPQKVPLNPKIGRGVWANISMKINLKSSYLAVNQALNREKRGQILTGRSMILGIDVTHPGSGAMKDSPSIAAVVGSVDSDFAQWPASLSMQMPEPIKDDPTKKDENPQKVKDDPTKKKQMPQNTKSGQEERPEMPKSIKDLQKAKQQMPEKVKDPPTPKKQSVEKVLQLRSMVRERLTAFCLRNEAMLPDQLVVYRDGLSEEQFEMCAKEEYPEILKAIDDLLADPRGFKVDGDKPKVLLICAVKRHHTRCFPTINFETEVNDSDTFIGRGPDGRLKAFNWNPMPGTLITERITYGRQEDFFLYSQNAIKGTARPTHYKILKNGPCSNLLDVAQMVSQDSHDPTILHETNH